MKISSRICAWWCITTQGFNDLTPPPHNHNLSIFHIHRYIAVVYDLHCHCCINTLRPRKNERHFADDIFKCIFVNENVWIPIKISMKFVPKGPINNIPALVQIMAWRCQGDKPLSEPMMVSLTTHICFTRPQWVKVSFGTSDGLWLRHHCSWYNQLTSLGWF